MIRSVSARALVALLVVSLAPVLAGAQVTCRPSGGSAEAQLLSYYAVPLAFSSALPTPVLARGEVAMALELTYVPSPSANTQRSDECFVAKAQHTELSPVLPRPRVAVGLPGGVVAEISYLPPVRVADATPSLLGLALSYGVPLNPALAVVARAHATVGHVDGAITCSRSSLQNDPAQPCFGTTPSDDRYSPNVYGAEVLAGVQLATGWRAVGGVGVSHARPRFQVGFVNGFDILDDTRIAYEFTRATGMLGFVRDLTARWDVGVLGYGVAGDGATVRLTAQWQLR